MTKSWTLRSATPADVEGITACVHAAYERYIDRIGKPPGPMVADYHEVVERHAVWVVELSDAIVGCLVLIPHSDHMLLDNIAVHPDYQGLGIGRALLDHADEETRRAGLSALRLYTHVKMHENLTLYPRLGWEETHRGVQDGYDRVFFRRLLTGTESNP